MKIPTIFGTVSLLLTVTSAAQQATITVVPELTDEILANPGMGWQTFHRTAGQDETLPDWIPSTVHYARWGWGELEPEPGTLNVEFLDRVLAESRESGQRLAFRVMCASTSPKHPSLCFVPLLSEDGGTGTGKPEFSPRHPRLKLLSCAHESAGRRGPRRSRRPGDGV